MSDHQNSDLKSALEEARASYLAKRPNTVTTHEEAVKVMPGGNTRTVLYHGPVPLRIAKGEGGYVEDVDGHRYLNLLGEYTAGIYGHSHPVIKKAVKDAIDGGINLTGHNTYEHRLAKLIPPSIASLTAFLMTG
jgi:glutamate-1-semialdehyde 2,1-aminomutase